MILELCNNIEKVEMPMEGIVQICGTNLVKKERIIESIIKYFSTSKTSFEEKQYNKVFANGKEIGKNYYKFDLVNGKSDLVKELQLGKSTIMKNILENKLEEFDYRSEVEKIKEEVEILFNKINEELLGKFSGIQIDFEHESLLNMIQKSQIYSLDGMSVDSMETFELVKNYLQLQSQNLKTNHVIVFKNIDHYLRASEYKKIYQLCKKINSKKQVIFLFTISLDYYCVVDKDNCNNILVVNEEDYLMPELSKIEEFILANYPVYKEIENIPHILEKIVNRISKSNYLIQVDEQVILKSINRTMMIEDKLIEPVNSLELKYLAN